MPSRRGEFLQCQARGLQPDGTPSRQQDIVGKTTRQLGQPCTWCCTKEQTRSGAGEIDDDAVPKQAGAQAAGPVQGGDAVGAELVQAGRGMEVDERGARLREEPDGDVHGLARQQVRDPETGECTNIDGCSRLQCHLHDVAAVAAIRGLFSVREAREAEVVRHRRVRRGETR